MKDEVCIMGKDFTEREQACFAAGLKPLPGATIAELLNIVNGVGLSAVSGSQERVLRAVVAACGGRVIEEDISDAATGCGDDAIDPAVVEKIRSMIPVGMTAQEFADAINNDTFVEMARAKLREPYRVYLKSLCGHLRVATCGSGFARMKTLEMHVTTRPCPDCETDPSTKAREGFDPDVILGPAISMLASVRSA